MDSYRGVRTALIVGAGVAGLTAAIALARREWQVEIAEVNPSKAKPFMHGYWVTFGEPLEDVSETINPALAWASGGIVSTLRDLSRFFRAYVGGKLFSRKARQAQNNFIIGSSQPPGPGRNQATLGLFRYTARCGRADRSLGRRRADPGPRPARARRHGDADPGGRLSSGTTSGRRRS